MRDELTRAERCGWRGISAPVQLAMDLPAVRLDDGWLAVARDPQDGQFAVSAWEDLEVGSRRCFAFWMPRESVERLRDELSDALSEERA